MSPPQNRNYCMWLMKQASILSSHTRSQNFWKWPQKKRLGRSFPDGHVRSYCIVSYSSQGYTVQSCVSCALFWLLWAPWPVLANLKHVSFFVLAPFLGTLIDQQKMVSEHHNTWPIMALCRSAAPLLQGRDLFLSDDFQLGISDWIRLTACESPGRNRPPKSMKRCTATFWTSMFWFELGRVSV